jgi:hypothetical protein
MSLKVGGGDWARSALPCALREGMQTAARCRNYLGVCEKVFV